MSKQVPLDRASVSSRVFALVLALWLPGLAIAQSAAQPSGGPASNAATTYGDTQRLDAMLAQMDVRASETAHRLAALDHEFAAINLGTAIKPANMITVADIAVSRRKVDAFTALVEQRSALVHAYFEGGESLIRSAGLAPRDAAAALEGLNTDRALALKGYDDLAQAQLRGAKVVGDLLAFARRNIERIDLDGGELIFESQAVLDDYRRLVQALNDASAREVVVMQRLTVLLKQQKLGKVQDLKR